MIDRLPSLTNVALRISGIVFLAAAVVIAAGGPAQASVITSYAGATGPGLGSVIFDGLATPAVGNDDVVGASANWISIQLMTFDVNDVIDLVFVVEDFGVPTTEYQVTLEVLNSTGQNWVGFAVELGYGTGSGFVESTIGDGLDFDAPDFNSPIDFPPFAVLTYDENYFDTFDGLIPDGTSQLFTYAVDVPNSVTEFTIRHRVRELPIGAAPSTWGGVKTLFR